MASATKLVFEFGDANDNSIFFSFPYGNPNTSSAGIKVAMNSIIANGSIFKKIPVSIKSAKTVVTTENDFDLDD